MTKIVKMVRTCFACPSQWDGWDAEGTYYYFRYRWGELRVDKEEIFSTVWEGSIGDSFDGSLSYDELKNALGDAFDLPEKDDNDT